MKLRYYLLFYITIFFISYQFAFSQTGQSVKSVQKSGKSANGDVIPAVRSFSPVSGHVGETLSIIFSGVNIFEGVTSVDFGQGIIVRHYRQLR
ncbi:MAG: hypothetical protein HY089_05170 [Ignavibacteriales bacterium]|nr:hypothetical protein [Ignavibacteriales bacterium]